jgi:single-strand DNA-binding protein
MASFNRVILAGNLTRDPEVRYTPKGTAVAKISLAINRTYTTESGEKKEEVSYVDVEAWGRQAETLAQYMKKGRPLLVEGRLKQDTWEDKNTHQKQSKLKVVLESFMFIDSKGANQAGGPDAPMSSEPPRARPAAASSHPQAQPAPAAAESEGPPPEDDDVPF